MKHTSIYTFLHREYNLAISLLDGNQAINELNAIHNFEEKAARFLKKMILTSLPFINILKTKENLGIYIDSDNPYYRFKLEMSPDGFFRTLLLPEEFETPQDFKISGKVRFTRFKPGFEPYTSLIHVESKAPEEVFNQIMEKSFQVQIESHVLNFDQSLSFMIQHLPGQSKSEKDLAHRFIKNLLSQGSVSLDDTKSYLTQNGFDYLSENLFQFKCPCSMNSMIENLLRLPQAEIKQIFEEESGKLDVRCDYCNTNYEILEKMVLPKNHH